MTAFSPHRTELLKSQLAVLASTVVHYMPPCDLSVDDFIKAFVRPEHYEFSREAPRVFGVETENFHFKHADMHVLAQLPRQPAVRVPTYAGNGMLLDAPPEIAEKLNKWINQRLAIGREFGIAFGVLASLNEICPTPQVMRFFWPPIVTLCGLTPELADLAEKLRAYKAPSKIPTIPSELRDAAAKSAGSIARAMLLPPLPEALHQRPKQVMLSANNMGRFKTPWGTEEILR